MRAADSHGAVDLSAAPASAASAAAPEAVAALDAPLIVVGDEANFDEVMSVSQTVPVVIAMWSGRSLESKPVLAALEELARDFAGAFQFVKIDIEAAPQIARAFQVQAVPSVVALIGGRPIPLFQGSASKEQMRPLIDEVTKAAAQMGVTGRIAVSAEQTSAPTPNEHLAPLALEADGDLEGAMRAWERVVELNPRDGAAKTHLARVRLEARTASLDGADPMARADLLFSKGDAEAAFSLLLDLVEQGQTPEDKDGARLRLLDLFAVAGNTPEVMKARMRLSTLVLI